MQLSQVGSSCVVQTHWNHVQRVVPFVDCVVVVT